jgi:hypothetical protein
VELSLELAGLLVVAALGAFHLAWSHPPAAVFGSFAVAFLASLITIRHRKRRLDSAELLKRLEQTLRPDLQGLFSAAFAAEHGSAAGSAPLLQAVRDQAIPLLAPALKLVQCPPRPAMLGLSLPVALALAFWQLPATPLVSGTQLLPSEPAWSRLIRSSEMPGLLPLLPGGTGEEAPLSTTQTEGGTTGEANKEAQRGDAAGSAGASGTASGASLEPGAGSSAGGASSPTASSTAGDAGPTSTEKQATDMPEIPASVAFLTPGVGSGGDGRQEDVGRANGEAPSGDAPTEAPSGTQGTMGGGEGAAKGPESLLKPGEMPEEGHQPTGDTTPSQNSVDPGKTEHLIQDTADNVTWEAPGARAGSGGVNDAAGTDATTAATQATEVAAIEEWLDLQRRQGLLGAVRTVDQGEAGAGSLRTTEAWSRFAQIAETALINPEIPQSRRALMQAWFQPLPSQTPETP